MAARGEGAPAQSRQQCLRCGGGVRQSSIAARAARRRALRHRPSIRGSRPAPRDRRGSSVAAAAARGPRTRTRRVAAHTRPRADQMPTPMPMALPLALMVMLLVLMSAGSAQALAWSPRFYAWRSGSGSLTRRADTRRHAAAAVPATRPATLWKTSPRVTPGSRHAPGTTSVPQRRHRRRCHCGGQTARRGTGSGPVAPCGHSPPRRAAPWPALRTTAATAGAANRPRSCATGSRRAACAACGRRRPQAAGGSPRSHGRRARGACAATQPRPGPTSPSASTRPSRGP
jgi:hypothetical protein